MEGAMPHIDKYTSRFSAARTQPPAWMKGKPNKPVVCPHFPFPHNTAALLCCTIRASRKFLLQAAGKTQTHQP